LGSFIYPNEIKKLVRAEMEEASEKKLLSLDKLLSTVETIHSTLYKYSHHKL